MKKIFVFILVSLCISCGGWIADAIDDLPGGYQYVFESKSDQIIHGHHKLIPCTVLDYKFNDDFILAFQEPNHRCMHFDYGWRDDIDSVDVIQFWIIDIKGDSLYGPLRLSDYLRMRDSLHVPDNLRLKLKL